ncbi:hypothetical protein [Parendozoicomonas sp. Alg238-R29]|uniref:hypothetical protein n=1 Tax=Parendozoicomonas sp. Alg238-R29 TaxID=2993446 RepID=UPI00248DB389|nr:hypothetical protein [Parendozoicomonas sp. Alg238-R29]
MPGLKVPDQKWLRWLPLCFLPLCFFILIFPGLANSTPLHASTKNRNPADISSSEYFCGGGICGENLILNRLPFNKRYEFADHPWTVQDSVVRLGEEESLGIASLVLMFLVGQGLINTFGNASRPFVSFGMQTAVDYAQSHNGWDWALRSGTNALNYYASGHQWSWWRQMTWFPVGHASLLGVHWKDLRAQMGTQYEGRRQIHFASENLDQFIELVLRVSGSGSRKHGELVIYIDQHNPAPDLPNTLEASWINLLLNCRNERITSVRLRPASNRHAMFVQLWRHDRMLSETELPLDIQEESVIEPVWLTEWLINREWPEGWQLGFDALIFPLTEPVLGALSAFVSQRQVRQPVSIVPLSGAVAPEGRMAVFSTGEKGYLLVDRNHTSDVAIPEMWLNTSDHYMDDIKIALAQLGAHQIPGRERGKPKVAFEALKSFVARMFLYLGLEYGGSGSGN